jgi:hypothetical protein
LTRRSAPASAADRFSLFHKPAPIFGSGLLHFTPVRADFGSGPFSLLEEAHADFRLWASVRQRLLFRNATAFIDSGVV